MAFGSHEGAFNDPLEDVMHEINMTPLVDVMLVLLIVFMITVPVMQQVVRVDLPQASATPTQALPTILRLDVDASGQYFVNGGAATDNALLAILKTAAAQAPQPQLHIRGDKAVRYERVAQAMASAQQAKLRKVSFVTQPQTPIAP